MKTAKSIFVSLFILITSLPALAGPRTFVSGFGDDANPGTYASPMRTLAAALLVTDADGEVIVLDSADYDRVTIFQSVSIIASPGVYAGINVTSDDAIFINNGAKIVLRGLTLNGNGTAGRGIYMGSGGVLHVEDCVISGFGDGISVLASTSTQTFIKDSFLRGNDTGIAISTGRASIDHVRAENNRIGMRTDTGTTTTVRNSVASGNSTGFLAFTRPGDSVATLILEACTAANNDTGITESFSAAVISNCTVTGNTTVGVAGLGGFVYSRQNSTVINNGTNVSASITPLSGT